MFYSTFYHVQGKESDTCEWSLIRPADLNPHCSSQSSLQKCCFVGTSRSEPCYSLPSPRFPWEDVHTNTDRPYATQTLKHFSKMFSGSAVIAGRSMEAAREGFESSSVTLAHMQPRDAHTSRDKAHLFFLTHLYYVNPHTVELYAGGELGTPELKV